MVTWETKFKDRSSPHVSIRKGITQFQTSRISPAKQKRQQRKDRLLHRPNSLRLQLRTHVQRATAYSEHKFDTPLIDESPTSDELLPSSPPIDNQEKEY